LAYGPPWERVPLRLVLSYQKAIPVTVVIAGVEHTQGIQFHQVATRLLLAILPPALLALTAQRFIVRHIRDKGVMPCMIKTYRVGEARELALHPHELPGVSSARSSVSATWQRWR
jgi:hypothetical protein